MYLEQGLLAWGENIRFINSKTRQLLKQRRRDVCELGIRPILPDPMNRPESINNT